MNELAVDEDPNDVVARAVDEVDRKPDSVGLVAIETARDHGLDEIVTYTAAI